MSINNNKLLNYLQQNARISVSQLAKRLFVSSPSVSEKVHKLERDGYITGYLTQINVKKLGYHVKVYVSVNVEPKDKQRFTTFLTQNPNVIFADVVTGDFTMMLCALFKESEDLETFINQVQKFGRTRTNMVFSAVLGNRGVKLDEQNRADD